MVYVRSHLAELQYQACAPYYARTTKEQEDRENAEARERFAASPAQEQHLNLRKHGSVEAECVCSLTDAGGEAAEGIRERMPF
jgi:hypothetical protein